MILIMIEIEIDEEDFLLLDDDLLEYDCKIVYCINSYND